MKVMFMFQGLPHYLNYLLNRLNHVRNISVVNVVPHDPKGLPKDVYQTRDDIDYDTIELDEIRRRDGRFLFPGFWRVLLREKPDVLVVTDAHIWWLLDDVPVRLLLRLLRIPLILKTIPFRCPDYDELKAELEHRLEEDLKRPSLRLSRLRTLLKNRGAAVGRALGGLLEWVLQRMRRWRGERRDKTILSHRVRLWRLPDAHVNYIDDAFRVYGSYGVPREKIFVTRNSPDTDRLLAVYEELEKEGIADCAHPHRLVHVGRFAEWKRVDLLLHAVSGLQVKYPDVELLILGSGPMEDEWRKLALVLGIGDRVEFVGGVYDPRDLGRYLMSSALYVLAGMGGLSINDAMSFGLPVICSVCDGTERHLVRDGYNGLFFREGDADDLAAKIDEIFRDPGRLREMGQNGQRIIREETNIHTVLRRYLDAFEYVTKTELPYVVEKDREAWAFAASQGGSSQA